MSYSLFKYSLQAFVIAALFVISAPALAQTPAYSVTQADAVTGDNTPVSFTHPNASCPPGDPCYVPDPNPPAGSVVVDSYTQDIYERPTGSGSAAKIYYPAIDIVTSQIGFDAAWVYYRINLYGLDASSGNLPYIYAYEINYDTDQRGDVIVQVNSPSTNMGMNWGTNGVFAYHDSNDDVGFTNITASDYPNSGDGYNSLVFDAGTNKLPGEPGGSDAVVARIAPGMPNSVELAVKRVFLEALNGAPIDQASFRPNAAKGTWGANLFYLHDKFGRNDARSPYPFLQLAGAPATCSNDALTQAEQDALDSGTHVDTGLYNPCFPSSNVYEFDNSGSLTAPPISFGPDLSILKSHFGDFIIGTNAVYTILISNSAAAAGTTGDTTVTDTLPAGLTYVSATGSGWSCSAAGQTVTCTNPGPLATGASSTIALTVSVQGPASVTNTATVTTAGDMNASNDSSSDATTVRPPTMIAGCRTSGLSGGSSSLYVPSGTVLAGTPGSLDAVDGSFFEIESSANPGVQIEFFTPPIGPGPVQQIDLQASVNVINGSGDVSLEVFNQLTSSWQTLQTVTPGPINVVLSASFGTNYQAYVDAMRRMRTRLVSPGSSARTLRIDQVLWTMSLGYFVDSALGNDANSGDIANPFATILQAASVLGNSGAVYVEVGLSRSGTPYAANIFASTPAQDGTAACRTLFLGLPDFAGRLPLVEGVDPSGDAGFAIGANYTTVDSFEIDNTLVGLYGDVGAISLIFSNNIVSVPSLAYGVLLNTVASGTVSGNQVSSAGDGTAGIWDYAGTSPLIDANKVTGFSSGGQGIWAFASSSPRIQRNIVTNGYIGIYFAHTTGTPVLYNNTVNANSWLGVYAEGTQGNVTSRNNILTNNGVGWAWNGVGTVQSNYDDVWNNGANYTYGTRGSVSAGANSISADPSFMDTSDPTSPNYYLLNSGSPCINAGTDVGLPFLGFAPDMGAVESQ